MDLIAQVAAAEEIQLAQIKASTAVAAGNGSITSSDVQGHTPSAESTALNCRDAMGVSVGSDLSTEVRLFVFGWADFTSNSPD